MAVYLTHRRIDMLPALLSSDLASLHGQRDRLALSITWRVTARRNNSTRDPVREVCGGDHDKPLLSPHGRYLVIRFSKVHGFYCVSEPLQ